ncbi:RNase adapter RapZ [Streptomyces sp. NRRL F-5123]|uniref:RapZ C-terminal domain-containing protein n=1 Tax=Streptomyces sp. NRRL F-5123 TaxID=1463856 RepID=UPI0004E24A89|nr:RNase adapter RapZ [Streptomyces sp. NRRL F-5123]
MREIKLISFGFLHDTPPAADLVFDLRPYRDPHVSPELRELTAHDQVVVDTVLSTPGINEVIESVTRAAAFALITGDTDVTVAIGCSGGRHRAPVVTDQVYQDLREQDWPVALVHRDLELPVVHR